MYLYIFQAYQQTSLKGTENSDDNDEEIEQISFWILKENWT